MANLTFLLTDNPVQAHRIRRLLMAIGSTVLVAGVMALLYWHGHMQFEGLIYSSSAMLTLSIVFYAIFRSGLNLKAKDPSLTFPMVLSSILTICLGMYYASDMGRGMLALLYIMSFFFGVFRLATGQLVLLAAITILVHLVMMGFWIRLRPDINIHLELVRVIIVTTVLIWFSTMGGYLGRLRKRLAVNKSELEKTVRTIHEMATTDELTSTANRRHLLDMLRREAARAARTGAAFSVCLADIDHFKRINDTLGHQGGDEILRSIAGHVATWLRASDYFGRYGGDEFMLILSDTSIEGACIAGERLRQEITRVEFPSYPDFSVTASIGVTEYRKGEDIGETIRRADEGLYKSKAAGRNSVAAA